MNAINLIFFILFLATLSAQAADLTVVEVRRNIPLSDEEPTYRDYIISSEDTKSLKKNLVVLVKRTIAMRSADSKDVGEIETAVAQIKIIHIDKKIAIGRDYKLVPRDDEAMLEYAGVMTGDRVDVAGAFVDSKPSKREPTALGIEKPAIKDTNPEAPPPGLQPEI